MLERFKYFHDSLNIVFVLAHDREFYCANCVQFPLTLTE